MTVPQHHLSVHTQAEQFFRLLGWHHATPEQQPGSGDPPPDVTGDLINRCEATRLGVGVGVGVDVGVGGCKCGYGC
jgi:hypothetical protein